MGTAAEATYTSGFIRLTRPQFIGTMAGLMLCLLLAALDQTIVGTAEPRIIASLAGFDRYPWVATAYLLTSTICVPIFAKLSDIYGRKWFFLLGAIVFVGASALCGASGNMNFLPIDGMGQLIVFRGLQGLGAGIMFGLVFTIVGDIFSPIERGKYQGLFASVFGAASIFGPTLGGWLTDHYSWRWCFYVNLPVGIIAIAAIYLEFPSFKSARRAPHHRLARSGHADRLPGAAAARADLGDRLRMDLPSRRMAAGDRGRNAGRVSVRRNARAGAANAAVSVSRSDHPRLLDRQFHLGIGMFGVIIYLPLFMQGVLGVSATRSGSLLTPMMLAAVTGNIVGGQTVSRTGKYKKLAIAGSVLIAGGMIVFASMDASTRHSMVVLGMVLSGIGMGFVQPVYTVAVQNAAPRHNMGTATASTQFFRPIGSTVGVAMFGSVLLTMYKRDFTNAVPPGTPAIALKPFNNPLLLPLIRPQLDAGFGKYPGGLKLLHTLLENVRISLVHGIQVIFLVGAVIMTSAVVLNLVLREIPLRGQHEAPAPVAD